MSGPIEVTALFEKLDEINLILLIPHGRAGSFFIQSLFDGHPEVLTFPSYFRDYGWQVRHANDAPDVFVREFCKTHAHFFDSSVSYIADKDWVTPFLLGPNQDEHFRVDLEVYQRHFVSLLQLIRQRETVTDRHVLIAAHLSLALTVGQDITPVRYVLFHQHGGNSYAPFVSRILTDFPSLYFIAATRDLRESWLSFRTLLSARWGSQDFFNFFISYIRLNLSLFNDLLTYYHRFAPGRVRIVNLNRLHELQADGMRSLARWLGIRFTATLTRSTFLGMTWWGNATDAKPLAGFAESKSVYRWPLGLTRLEIDMIEYMSGYLCEPFGFPAATMRLGRASFYARLFLHPQLINIPRRNSLAVRRTRGRPLLRRTLDIARDGLNVSVKSLAFFLQRFALPEILRLERARKQYGRGPSPIGQDAFLQ